MKKKLEKTAAALTARLQAIDYNSLPISDYNKEYTSRLKPVLSYYMKIYSHCLQEGLKRIDLPLSEITMVDFGGGSGFLSMLAKEIGIGQVIYLDINPLSVETIKLLKEKTGTGPDFIVEGDVDVLAAWCKEHERKPHLTIGIDVIEHLFYGEFIFEDLKNIYSPMIQIFTTASNDENPRIKKKLIRMMEGYENGSLATPNYYTLRLQYIKKHYPEMPQEEAELISRNTRGYIYEYIDGAIKEKWGYTKEPGFNTCDPETGNYVERILSFFEYHRMAASSYQKLYIQKGFYNTERNNRWFSLFCKCANAFIRCSGKPGFRYAPFIVLICVPQEE